MEFVFGLEDGTFIPRGTLIKIPEDAPVSRSAKGLVIEVSKATEVGKHFKAVKVIQNPNGWKGNGATGYLTNAFGVKFPDNLTNHEFAHFLNPEKKH